MLNRYESVTSYYTANYNTINKLFGPITTDYQQTDKSYDCNLCDEIIMNYNTDDAGIFYLQLEY